MNAHETLSQWLEAEQSARANQVLAPGCVDMSQAAGQSGAALFEAMLAGHVPPVPIGATLDFLLVHAEPGHAVFQGRPQVNHYNPLGTVHGGWFCTLLDSAVGCAVHSALPAGKGYTTIELKVNLIRALTDKVPRVRAEGRVIHLGGQVATAEGRLVGPDGRLYAHASTTCLVFDLKPRKAADPQAGTG